MNLIGSPWDETNIAGLLFGYISAEVLPPPPPTTVRIAEVSVSSELFLLRYPDAPNLSTRGLNRLGLVERLHQVK
jgi:hypothetical protein